MSDSSLMLADLIDNWIKEKGLPLRRQKFMINTGEVYNEWIKDVTTITRYQKWILTVRGNQIWVGPGANNELDPYNPDFFTSLEERIAKLMR